MQTETDRRRRRNSAVSRVWLHLLHSTLHHSINDTWRP